MHPMPLDAHDPQGREPKMIGAMRSPRRQNTTAHPRSTWRYDRRVPVLIEMQPADDPHVVKSLKATERTCGDDVLEQLERSPLRSVAPRPFCDDRLAGSSMTLSVGRTHDTDGLHRYRLRKGHRVDVVFFWNVLGHVSSKAMPHHIAKMLPSMAFKLDADRRNGPPLERMEDGCEPFPTAYSS